jgi:uncharacterized protein DUF1570
MAARAFLLGFALVLPLIAPSSSAALEHVTFKHEGRELIVDGQLLVKAADGGLLLQAADGELWTVPPEELVKHTSDDEPFKPLTAAELGKQLLKDLPPGFELYTTQNYVICHNTSRAYAQWSGALFEKLYAAFTNYWSRRGFELKKPEFPLVALVFADKNSYATHAQKELGQGASSIIGYYSLATNRMTMFDLTGIEAFRRPGDRRTTAAQINEMLNRPEAEMTVATVVHEATHQIAFNCGLQTRYSDVPLWLSEGLAVYFETPDLGSATGWRSIGNVNRVRLTIFRDYLTRRPANSLKTLLTDDDRLRQPRTANEAYAEAWALNYFLIRQRPKQYVEYFRFLAEKPRLVWDDPATRLEEFQHFFGENLGQLDAEFLRHMSKVR